MNENIYPERGEGNGKINREGTGEVEEEKAT